VVQQTLCAEKTPTLGNVVPQFELFMSLLEVPGSQSEELRPITDVGIKWATKYYQHMDDSWAYAIAMCKLPQIYISAILKLFSHQPCDMFLLDQKALGIYLCYENDQDAQNAGTWLLYIF
jgi:hypothetical protein